MTQQTPTRKFTTMTTIVAVLIQEHRKIQRLGQADLAAALKVTTSAYTKMELCQSPISVEKLITIATIFKMMPSTLLDHTEKLAIFMTHRGWVVHNDRRSESGDDLLKAMKEYRGGIGFTEPKPQYGCVGLPSVIASIFDEVTQRPDSGSR